MVFRKRNFGASDSEGSSPNPIYRLAMAFSIVPVLLVLTATGAIGAESFYASGQSDSETLGSASLPGVAVPGVAVPGDDELDSLEKWIDQLADPSYTRRQAAQAAILQMGGVALDGLHEASFHPDPQIAAAARFLLQSNQLVWTSDLDSPVLRQILNNYAVSEVNAKSAFIEQLARLERDEGIPALCRLARYETTSVLAKKAALCVMQSPTLAGVTDRQRKMKIARYVDGARNVACSWIQKYVEDDSIDLNWWRGQIQNEKLAVSGGSANSNRETLSLLSRWLIETLASSESQRDQAILVGEEYLANDVLPAELSAPISRSNNQPEDFAVWALDLGLPELVQKQHAALPVVVSGSSGLLTYYLAESYLKSGDVERAENIAQFAHQRKPVLANGEIAPAEANTPTEVDRPGMKFVERPETSRIQRYILGTNLKKRGMFEWAIKELNDSVGESLANVESIRALYELSAIHASFERYDEARDVLKPLYEMSETDPSFRMQMVGLSDVLGGLLSSYHLYAGDSLRVQGETSKAAESYLASLKASATNVDAIIGLYKLDVDAEMLKQRKAFRDQSVKKLRDICNRYETFLEGGAGVEFARSYQMDLAIQLNSLAWLISNTEGDFQEAVQLSRRACNLSPNSPELLDTLAHAYFSAGAWHDAVDQQRRALKLMPHLPEFQRALARFEAKLSEEVPDSP